METSVSSAFDSSAAAAAPTFAVSSKVSFVAFACQVGSARMNLIICSSLRPPPPSARGFRSHSSSWFSAWRLTRASMSAKATSNCGSASARPSVRSIALTGARRSGVPIRALRTFRWSCANWTRAPWRSRSGRTRWPSCSPTSGTTSYASVFSEYCIFERTSKWTIAISGCDDTTTHSSCHRGRSPFSTTLRDVYTRPLTTSPRSSPAPASRPPWTDTRTTGDTTALSDGTYAPRRRSGQRGSPLRP